MPLASQRGQDRQPEVIRIEMSAVGAPSHASHLISDSSMFINEQQHVEHQRARFVECAANGGTGTSSLCQISGAASDQPTGPDDQPHRSQSICPDGKVLGLISCAKVKEQSEQAD